MSTYEQKYDPKLWEQVRNNKSLRVKLARESLYWFFHLYFGENAQYPTADFQKEIYLLLENPEVKHAVVVAFRGSGKSTITTLAYPIWAILGKPENKFVLILSQTQPLARMHLQNIKRTFEGNELLRNDFGPVNETSDEWGSTSLVIPKYNARISTASTDQSIRGIRHGAHRPDLIIADDVEDMNSVQTQEGRDRTFDWFVSEVIPAGDKETKIVNIGNLLHEDSLLMRLKDRIGSGKLNGEYREYPIVGEDKEILWPGKYPNIESITEQQNKTIDERSWQREYCLKIIASEGQLINPEWLNYYDDLVSPSHSAFSHAAFAVDLAIAQGSNSDYTAIVAAYVLHDAHDKISIFILPEPINERMEFPTTVEKIKMLDKTLLPRHRVECYVESNGFQESVVQQLKNEGYRDINSVKVGANKRVRLQNTTHVIKDGTVLFPREGCEDLITQLLGFGKEKHDDLADAFSLLVSQIILNERPTPGIYWI